MDILIYILANNYATVGILVIFHVHICPGLCDRKQFTLLLVNSTIVLPRSKAQPHPYWYLWCLILNIDNESAINVY